MPLAYAIVPKQPGENEPWSFEFIPGKNIPTGDSLTGSPTVKCYRIPSGENTTPITTGSVSLTFASAGKTITRASGSFIDDGFVVGDTIVTTASLNPGTFTVTNVTATVLTVTEAVSDEGPVSKAITTETTSAMIEGVSSSGDTVLWRVKSGMSGYWYKVTILVDTTLGGQDIEEDIAFEVIDL